MKMKSLKYLLIPVIALMTAACSEYGIEDEFHDWQSRNESFIDSISKADDVVRILSYRLDPAREWDKSDYVYCKKLSSGSGTVNPIFTDSVYIHYRGRLIPTPEHPQGYVFDQSYKSEKVDPLTSNASGFKLASLVIGMITGIQEMKEGDSWRIYIPCELGYGSSKSGSIPAYSALIFDVNLERIVH